MDIEMEQAVHIVRQPAPGVFGTVLAPCSCQVLRQLLFPEPESVVWLVAYHPHGIVEWVDLPLPLAAGAQAEPVCARLPRYDLQFGHADFLARLPRMHARSGMLALQLRRRVPDTLVMEHLADDPRRHDILRQNGWMLTFDLPHDGEYAWVETPEPGHLERLLTEPPFVSRDLP